MRSKRRRIRRGDAVVDNEIDVGDVVGEGVALVVDGALGKEDGGQVEHPASEGGLICPNNSLCTWACFLDRGSVRAGGN